MRKIRATRWAIRGQAYHIQLIPRQVSRLLNDNFSPDKDEDVDAQK